MIQRTFKIKKGKRNFLSPFLGEHGAAVFEGNQKRRAQLKMANRRE